MQHFARQLCREWRRLKQPMQGAAVIAAVSGGADSVSLLCALHELKTARKLNLHLIAAHFDHDLRGAESENDAAFVRDLAARLKIDFVTAVWRRTPNGKNLKGNLEQAARRARYNFLSAAALENRAFAVATAHTLDDQAETFLLRLIRGSGADGLGGMRDIRRLRQNQETLLIRPLLNWARRADTEDYCRAAGIEFRRDAMNDDEKFSRVKVRKQILPLLQKLNPQIAAALAQTADLLREDADELNSQAARLLLNVKMTPFRLDARELKNAAAAIQKRVLRLWLKELNGDLKRIENKHLQGISTMLSKNIGGKTIELPGGAAVRLAQNQLIFVSQVDKTTFAN